MGTGTPVRAAPHMMPVPMCSIFIEFMNFTNKFSGNNIIVVLIQNLATHHAIHFIVQAAMQKKTVQVCFVLNEY